MWNKKSKCEICNKELKPHEVRTNARMNYAGKWYVGTTYHDLCKSCYEIRIKAEDKVLKQFGIFVLVMVIIFIVAVVISMKLSQ